MKSTLSLVIFTIAFSASAEQHNHKAHQAHGQHHSKNKKEVTLKGKLIGLTCFVKHGATGKTHKSCAKDCAAKGLPIGLLDEAGKIFTISGKGHDSLKEAYKPLLKYLEEKVMVKGEVFEKNGISLLVIDKIKKS